jgi:C1A family cysteine protease
MKYGWRHSLPDHRDYYYSATTIASLPSSIDLRGYCPPVYDQGPLGSCTANAIASAIEYDRIKQGLSDFIPSRLFIYYNERIAEHTVNSDSGAAIRDGIKSVIKQGVCNEVEWPYDTTKFATMPPAQCYTDALQFKVLRYERLRQNLLDMRSLLSTGIPFVFGFAVYDSFESQEVANTGIVPMPSKSESMLGGHAVLCVGYSDHDQTFLVRNSWGSTWGIKGYFTLPYAYLASKDLSSDLWALTLVE